MEKELDFSQRSNVPELSVSELAFSLKRTLEETYGRVRVRGELSRVKIHTSGHLYTDLKDADAVLNAVCWKGTVAQLGIKPEEGLEVVCTGRISSYPARSNYQMIIESMELAGEGALLKMLEDRRKRLMAEGLFGQDRKKRLPYLPDVIGVITSPTGAVIRDIMHRLNDRFPRRVLLWPVIVQGPGTAQQVANAIKGFESLSLSGSIPRPDVLIVARGGGSLEDLMPFNEEIVVRAAADCSIPLISAVGHETDTTLIDYAADVRAPTPTAAAEMAVPRRLDLLATIRQAEQRVTLCLSRGLTEKGQRVETLGARLGDPRRLLELKMQTLDTLGQRLDKYFEGRLKDRALVLQRVAARLGDPRRLTDTKAQILGTIDQRLDKLFERTLKDREIRLHRTAGQLRSPQALAGEKSRLLESWQDRLHQRGQTLLQNQRERLALAGSLLETLSFRSVLRRGYAVVQDAQGHLVSTATATGTGDNIQVRFGDDSRLDATVTGKE